MALYRYRGLKGVQNGSDLGQDPEIGVSKRGSKKDPFLDLNPQLGRLRIGAEHAQNRPKIGLKQGYSEHPGSQGLQTLENRVKPGFTRF